MHRRWDTISLAGLSVGPTMVDVFEKLGFFRVFSAPWFLLLLTVLVVAIVCCTLDRTPRLWRSARLVHVEQPDAFFDLRLSERALLEHAQLAPDDIAGIFRRRHFRVRRATSAATDETWVYGDRNQYMKLATLLTHLGLILFLLGGAVTGRLRLRDGRLRGRRPDRAGAAGGHARQPAGQGLQLLGAAARRRLVRRLQHRPGGLPERPADRAQDHPRQRSARGQGLRVPPEHLRAQRRCRHPRCGRPAGVDRAGAAGGHLRRAAAGLHDHPRFRHRAAAAARPGRRWLSPCWRSRASVRRTPAAPATACSWPGWASAAPAIPPPPPATPSPGRVPARGRAWSSRTIQASRSSGWPSCRSSRGWCCRSTSRDGGSGHASVATASSWRCWATATWTCRASSGACSRTWWSASGIPR